MLPAQVKCPGGAGAPLVTRSPTLESRYGTSAHATVPMGRSSCGVLAKGTLRRNMIDLWY